MKKLAELRKKHNLSQRELAEAIEVTQASISRWEKDHHSISGHNLLKLSQYFNVSVDEILENKLMRRDTNVREETN